MNQKLTKAQLIARDTCPRVQKSDPRFPPLHLWGRNFCLESAEPGLLLKLLADREILLNQSCEAQKAYKKKQKSLSPQIDHNTVVLCSVCGQMKKLSVLNPNYCAECLKAKFESPVFFKTIKFFAECEERERAAKETKVLARR